MRLGSRVTTPIDDGEYAGASATVDQIIGWPVFAIGSARMAEFLAAEGEAELKALLDLYGAYEKYARPVWNVEDGAGPVPPTAEGMLRLPVPLVETLYHLWLATFPGAEAPESTAVDEIIPPGPLRDELNAGLRAAKE
jgi:hypothetical protein